MFHRTIYKCKTKEKIMELKDKAYYWVKVFKGDDWEIGRYREVDGTMRFTNGSYKETIGCFDICNKEIKK